MARKKAFYFHFFFLFQFSVFRFIFMPSSRTPLKCNHDIFTRVLCFIFFADRLCKSRETVGHCRMGEKKNSLVHRVIIIVNKR